MNKELLNALNLATIIDLWEEYEEYLRQEKRVELNIIDETKEDFSVFGFRDTYKHLLNFDSFINWLKTIKSRTTN